VLADPELPSRAGEDDGIQARESGSSASGLGRLPYARGEGARVLSLVGGRGQLLLGPRATEEALKKLDAAPFSIVHFATHALVDERFPERSAVLLASDGRAEDGLLQPREIVGFRLDGQVIVLSACRSVTGSWHAGEGVMDLSRYFIEAGARTVVGTLWALRDDHAAAFFGAFYASLRLGRTVGEAQKDARVEAIRRGVPVSAWSSVVVIGDAAARPLPRGSRGAGVLLATGLVTIAAVCWLLGATTRRSRRRR
jgi:CHAT domain-containing protein